MNSFLTYSGSTWLFLLAVEGGKTSTALMWNMANGKQLWDFKNIKMWTFGSIPLQTMKVYDELKTWSNGMPLTIVILMVESFSYKIYVQQASTHPKHMPTIRLKT